MRADAIDQSRVQRIEALGPRKHVRVRLSRVRLERSHDGVDCRMTASPEGATHVIEERPPRFVAHVVGDALHSICDNERCKRSRL